MIAVIMAGGKGTRISSMVSNVPKPMIKINGIPVLEHEINCLRRQGIRDIIITVSHLADVIIRYFGDGSGISPSTGKNFDVHIEYFREEKALGNAGALFFLLDKLKEDFILLNADVIFDVNFSRMIQFHRDNNALVSLLTHPNNHPYDSGLIISDEDFVVLDWLNKEDVRPIYYKNRVNAGVHIINPKIFELLEIDVNSLTDGVKLDLDRQILKPLIDTGRIYCYDSPEYVKDMGTPERYADVENDYISGRIHQKNLSNKQKAIFLDRDGTINKHIGFLRDINQFELLEGVAPAIRKINSSGYLCIVVTNQAVIARGDISFAELRHIHNKMETLLGNSGAYIDAIYYCPHHPHKGFTGEIESLKIDCNCRKPKPGMLLEATAKYNIDLSSSWMVGDSMDDVLAGKRAGCKTVLIEKIANKNSDYGQDKTVSNLLEFVNECIE